jgi:SAM-dependent methyltransferase
LTEAERLRIQARAWHEQAEALLDVIGIQPGWRCADIGCGAVGHLELLSRRVGPEGQVIGVDIDPVLASEAWTFVAKEKLRNVEIQIADMYDTGLPDEYFDLVHLRFVLCVVAGDTLRVRDELLRLTRPGGLVVLEEPDLSSWNCFPMIPAWQRLKAALTEAFRRDNCDLNFGSQVFGFLRDAGLKEVKARAAALAVQDGSPYMKTLLTFVELARHRLRGHELMTDAEMDVALEECRAHLAEPSTFVAMPLLIQVWGRKPAH